MTIRNAVVGSVLVFFLMFLLGATGAGARSYREAQAASGPALVNMQQPTPSAPSGADEAIRTAFQTTAAQNQALILGFQIYDPYIDNIQYSQDGKTALLWMGLRDRDTGLMIETEPGLSIATNPNAADPASAGSWSIMLPAGQTFTDQLRSLPPELLSEDIRYRFLEGPAALQPETLATLGGYKLPWTAGVAKRVTNSIGHVYTVSGGLTSCPATCRYAFDFADGTMFPMLASKGGTVKAAKWTCANGSTDCTNYLVLEDESTIPTSYQLYYHMAANSIPDRLRTVGAVVRQGEFIGDADDTGASTGHHLHFHVYNTPNASNWSWGNSVDVTFDDVSINGGRPRTCAEAREYPNMGSECAANSMYTSGNTPANPPSGTLDLPADRQTVNTRVLRVQGSASDDLQITRIQVMANYDGTWKRIDDIVPTGNGPYSKDVDLCSANIPEGPVSLTVRIYDREGSTAPGVPVRHLIKNANCGSAAEPPVPPACIPSANQVALYADPDFRGACKNFDLNPGQGYTVDALSPVGDDNAASILVGSGVMAVLMDSSSDVAAARPLGRVETLASSDAGLADNLIGANTVSGLWVISRGAAPKEPLLNPIGSRMTGNNPTSTDSLVLSWEDGAGAASYDVRLTGPGANLTRSVTGNSLSVGSLAAGSYTFSVTARNAAGQNASQTTFNVSSAALPAATAKTLPFQDTMEAGAGSWVSNGLWRLGSFTVGDRTSRAWIYNNSTSYADTTWRAGDLTSPPITLPAGTASYLRFLYHMDTQDSNSYWDQPRVQVSANGGPFEDVHLLNNGRLEGGDIWLNSGAINLQRYAGTTIRLRFHMDTVDEDRNSGKGWVIDDITVNTTAPNMACADNNNTAETAQQAGLGEVINAAICPEGDLDYYQISGTAGYPLTVDINARSLSPASKLDGVVQLLDADGRSVIAENDDEQSGTMVDPLLKYVLQRTGIYYIRVRAWNHPGVGGADYPYQLDLRQQTPISPRNVSLVYPSGRLTSAGPFTIEASAVDFDGGQPAAIDFYWHGPDWNAGWVKLGTDINGSDGWTFNVNPASYGGVRGSAVYVQAISRTGGVLGTALWDLDQDTSLPTSQMNGLPAQVNSTAVQLTWTASDEQNDFARFEVEYQRDSGGGFSGWQPWTARTIAGNLRSVYFVGNAGSSYRFRIRAVDRAGNVEPYPESFEAVTFLTATCAPDPNENGQTADIPFRVSLGQPSPLLNLCRSAQAGSDDVDWLAFDATAGQQLLLKLVPRGGPKLAISLYSSSSELLGTWQSADYGVGTTIQFAVPRSTTYFMEIKPAHTGLFGTDMAYQAWFGTGTLIYLPEIHR